MRKLDWWEWTRDIGVALGIFAVRGVVVDGWFFLWWVLGVAVLAIGQGWFRPEETRVEGSPYAGEK